MNVFGGKNPGNNVAVMLPFLHNRSIYRKLKNDVARILSELT